MKINLIGLELLKNQFYSTPFVIKPIEEADDLIVGEMELSVFRREDVARSDKGNYQS
jgi:hypothetical protein